MLALAVAVAAIAEAACGLASMSFAAGADLSASFPPGSGAKFGLQVSGTQTHLVISVTDVSSGRVGIEYYFYSRSAFAPVEMWQQFVLEVPGKGPVRLVEGYVLAKELKAPEKMTSEYLKGAAGVQMDDFLFADAGAIDGKKVGREKVSVPAGSIEATHYAVERGEQKVDFWVADSVRPIGTVKVVSKGKKPEHNYTLELETLLEHVKPKIDRAKAVPLSDEGRKMLATPTR